MKSLINQVLSGNPEAVTQFYQLYAPKIERYLQKKLPHDDAKEITNDVFLEAIDSLPTLHDKENVQGWLYRIAHHKMVDYYRKQKLKSFALSKLPFLELVASEMHEPEFQMEKNKIRDSLEMALHKISDKYRHVLFLHYEEGLPIKDIATILNLTPKATESLLFRARQSFKEAYGRA